MLFSDKVAAPQPKNGVPGDRRAGDVQSIMARTAAENEVSVHLHRVNIDCVAAITHAGQDAMRDKESFNVHGGVVSIVIGQTRDPISTPVFAGQL